MVKNITTIRIARLAMVLNIMGERVKLKYNTFQKAKELGVNKLAAARVRSRCLLDSAEVYLEDGSDLCLVWAREALDEVLYLLSHAAYTQVENPDNRTTTTPEMIDSALAYPIENLIHVVNGKALAFCHNDTHPSLSLKDNKLMCFVCNKRFNPIDVIMHFNDIGYYDAVRYLCNI
jgi:hypothetical protein